MRIQPNLSSPPTRRIIQTWWPLAASWLLMSVELPALSAVVARLPHPEINLAAYGGIVFPLALIIEAPIIMLLSASTAVCADWDAYRKVRRFMMAASATLTGLHILIAFTPLYDLLVREIVGVPEAIVEPGRIGLQIMIPWTWAIAYRRFNQGVLIRFGHSRAVGAGTVIRLSTNATVLVIGYLIGTLSGIVVAASAVAAGVISEAIYAGLRVQPVLRQQVRLAHPSPQPLTLRSFLEFYTPLAMTSLLWLLAQPIGSAALSRMPEPLASLAAWPVLMGLLFMLRSLGLAYNEVVVALLGEPGLAPHLIRFTGWLAALTTVLLALIAATPIATLWFTRVSALSAPLVALATTGLWLALPIPAFSALQSWFQGAILHSRRTAGITQAVVIYLLVSATVFVVGVAWGRAAGVYIGLAAMTLSTAAQTGWLWHRSRAVWRAATGA